VSDLPARISVREVGPRDGLQNEDPVPTDAKIELIDRLSGTGVARIEAVSFVRPEAIPQMADASEVWQGITPRRVRDLVGEFRSAHPGVPLNLHFHNTRGTGLANVLTALELGVADFDASVGGLGGCPYAPGATGNIATEELVHMVEDMGVATGIDLAAMIDAAADAERIIGRRLPSQVLRAGPRTRTIPVS
jgi:hydroxymethylglutaryl-CoA lyase